jgi:undecaprenyl pyrophosphate phosphatase UppP
VNHVRAFGRFWWDFVVGDDPRLTSGVAVAIVVTWLLVHEGVDAWWLLPAAVALLLAESLRRRVRS